MPDQKPETPELLDRLLRIPAPSGYEEPAARAWRKEAAFARVSSDALGSSIATIGDEAAGPLVAVVGHIDEIGLVIRHIDDKGFLHFGPIGGWDPQILIGQRVVVEGRSGPVQGVAGRKPIHLLDPEQRKKVVELKEMHLDIGATGDVAIADHRNMYRARDRRNHAPVGPAGIKLVAGAGVHGDGACALPFRNMRKFRRVDVRRIPTGADLDRDGQPRRLYHRADHTAGHQRRVARLAGAIARKLGVPEQSLFAVERAALLHDVGKIEVPAEILSKPGSLSTIEMGIVKQHVEAGWKILKNIALPWPLAEIVYQHHELLDGSGYPRGLRGDEICIEARIITVADIVEAMASHRPFRPSRGLEAALGEIGQQKGSALDERVVDACLEIFRVEGFKLE